MSIFRKSTKIVLFRTISKPNESITKTNPLPLKRTQTILDRNKVIDSSL